jgi:Phage integrase, N-terminal SAM-like domain
MIYKRGKGGIYWFRFRFGGRFVHESARTTSKTIAREGERQRRRELETKWNHIERRSLPPTFARAGSAWLEAEKPHLAERTYEIYDVAVRCHLTPSFGPQLICDISADNRLVSGSEKRDRRFGPDRQQGASSPPPDIETPQAVGEYPGRREV